jgi:hypothetical protein
MHTIKKWYRRYGDTVKTVQFLSRFACGCISAASFIADINTSYAESVVDFLVGCDECDSEMYIEFFTFDPSDLVTHIKLRKLLKQFIYSKFQLELEKCIALVKTKILQEIDICFNHIHTLPSAYTLEQAEVLDNRGTDEDFLNASKNKVKSWRQINLDTAMRYSSSVFFLNGEGLVSYIPALMQWSILRYDTFNESSYDDLQYGPVVSVIERIFDNNYCYMLTNTKSIASEINGEMKVVFAKYLFFANVIFDEYNDNESLRLLGNALNCVGLDVKDVHI